MRKGIKFSIKIFTFAVQLLKMTMEEKIQAYKRIRPIIFMLMGIIIFELVMLAVMIKVNSIQIWITFGIVALSSVYIAFLCLKLIQELIKVSKQIDDKTIK